MNEQRCSGGREVHLLKDICLDALAGFTEVEWFRHFVLPRSLADYYYTRLQRRRLLKDHLVPVVLHAKSIEADLAESPVTGAALVHIRKCTQLEKLTFSSVPLDDSLCETSCASAELICCRRTCREDCATCRSVFSGLLETVRCFHNLRWLELTGVSTVTDSVLAAIAEQNKLLTILKLNECANFGDKGLKALGQNCHFLKCVDFSSTQITTRGLDALANSPCSLTIEEFLANRCSKLEAEAVEILMTNFPSLRILSLEDCRQILFAPEAVPVRMERKGQLSWFIFC